MLLIKQLFTTDLYCHISPNKHVLKDQFSYFLVKFVLVSSISKYFRHSISTFLRLPYLNADRSFSSYLQVAHIVPHCLVNTPLFNLSLNMLLCIIFSPKLILALTQWFECSSVSNSLCHIFIVPVHSRTAYFDICIVSCFNTPCSNSPRACSIVPKCSAQHKDAVLYSQLFESSSLISLLSSGGFWPTTSTAVLQFLTPLLLATATFSESSKLPNTFPHHFMRE